MGQCLLPIPSSPSDPKVSTECNERKNRDHNCSSLANNDMVVIDSGDIGGCSLVASTQLYIRFLPQNPELSLKLLSYKALFLFTICTLSRVNTASRLGPDLLVHKVG